MVPILRQSGELDIKLKKKISFRMELILFMIISLLISFAGSFFIRNRMGHLQKTDEEKRFHKIYEECIGNLEEELMNYSLEDEHGRKEILARYCYLVGYTFYLVDKYGNVIDATVNDVIAINGTEIYDGMKKYSASNQDKNIFQIQGCDYLKEGIYLYYTYLKYDENDTGMVFGALTGSILCFFLLIWGRISYISKIRTAVARITDGDLNHRISYKYHNELCSLAEDINKMAETLAQEEKKRNEFMTNVSHDIRTPLTTILGYLEMIQEEKYESKEEMQGYLSIMKRKGDFLASMLEDFFQYSKLQSGDVKMECVDFELNELLRQLYEDEVEEFVQNSLELEIDLCEQNTSCHGDTELLARVVNNLLSNTLKYSKENTKVMIKSFVENKFVCFHVKSTPRDIISQEKIELLFERQYKCNAARSGEGSGLGLTIVKSIVKLHSGAVSADMEGEDIIFTVSLTAKS